MKLMDGIKTRRSIRKYKKTNINIKKIKEIIKAAIMAPSAHNSNPWYFIIINEENLKMNLATEMAKKYKRDLESDGYDSKVISKIITDSISKFTNAPILIIVCLDMKKMQAYSDKKRQEIEHCMGIQSVSAATENLLLAAHALGLASCWYCAPLFAQQITKNQLKIPKNIEPQALITLGFPVENKHVKPPPRRAFSKICFLNKWGEDI